MGNIYHDGHKKGGNGGSGHLCAQKQSICVTLRWLSDVDDAPNDAQPCQNVNIYIATNTNCTLFTFTAQHDFQKTKLNKNK